MDNSVCLCKNISKEHLMEIINSMPTENIMKRQAEFFRLFGDLTRLRILYVLMHQELCVADLANLLGLQQPAISQQLKILRLSRLVKYRKDGKIIYYSLDDLHVGEIFNLSLKHVMEV